MCTFDMAVKNFMCRCYAKNLSENTITAYEVFFRHLKSYMEDVKLTEDITQVKPSDVRGYLVYASKTMKGITLVGYYRRLHTFFAYLKTEGIIRINPVACVDKPKAGKHLIQSFSSEEVDKMLNAFDTDTFIGRRNYTILCLLLSTGMRRTEFLNLTMFDVNLQSSFIRVTGKGDKERIIPIGKSLGVILRKYVKSRETYMKKYLSVPFFFVTKTGTQMSKGASDTMFRKLRKDLCLTGKRFSAHTWRHTFAKAFLLNGGDVFTLQELLGHAEVDTTRIYVHYNDMERQQQNRRYNPLDNNKWRYY